MRTVSTLPLSALTMGEWLCCTFNKSTIRGPFGCYALDPRFNPRATTQKSTLPFYSEGPICGDGIMRLFLPPPRRTKPYHESQICTFPEKRQQGLLGRFEHGTVLCRMCTITTLPQSALAMREWLCCILNRGLGFQDRLRDDRDESSHLRKSP